MFYFRQSIFHIQIYFLCVWVVWFDGTNEQWYKYLWENDPGKCRRNKKNIDKDNKKIVISIGEKNVNGKWQIESLWRLQVSMCVCVYAWYG